MNNTGYLAITELINLVVVGVKGREPRIIDQITSSALITYITLASKRVM